jgi:photosystem II stability/assembly factor-like uncharacterized protein
VKHFISFIAIGAILVITPLMTQAQLPPVWVQMTNSPAGTTPRFDDIFFVNESTGWTARSTGGIYKTTNGGDTWIQTLSKPTTHFRSIGFASATRGWAGNLGPGSYDATVTDTNVLYETFDGGLTWTNHPGFAEQGMRGLCAMHILDAQHIYGGGRVRGPAYFIKSVDGGTTWSMTNLTAAGVMGGIMDIYFKDQSNGFIVGMSPETFADNCASVYHGRIARTTNGGLTWNAVATTTVQCCYFWKMSWPTPEIGYVSLQKNPTSSDSIVFYKTTDGGTTWASNGIPVATIGIPSFYWQGIGFINANEGWAGGDSNATFLNSFLHTVDGGATWSPAGYNNSQRINRIRFVSPNVAVASGARLNVYKSPLAITNQPQSQWASSGVNVSLDVGVSGYGPFAYQWKKGGTNIQSATNSSLTLSNVARASSGTYSVTVTNSWGSQSSSNALVRVFVPQLLRPPAADGAGEFLIQFGDSDGGLLSSNDLAGFEVQAATNLVDWTPLTNALSISNGMIWLQDSSGYPQRFYRVLEH